MHCRGHQKGKTAPKLGNCFTDEAARGVAEKDILAVVPQKEIDLSGLTPKHYQRDHKLGLDSPFGKEIFVKPLADGFV